MQHTLYPIFRNANPIFIYFVVSDLIISNYRLRYIIHVSYSRSNFIGDNNIVSDICLLPFLFHMQKLNFYTFLSNPEDEISCTTNEFDLMDLKRIGPYLIF